MAPHDRQCQLNHGGQTLERIAARGGLGAAEAECVVSGRRYPFCEKDEHDHLRRAWFYRAERVNRDWCNGKDHPLTCQIEGQQLVIRIGIDTLAFCAERCTKLYDYDKHRDSEKYCTVVNNEELANDVATELQREREDGATPLHFLFDNAIVAAMEDGSLAFKEEE
jgi:hypothetical protein